MNEMAQVLNIDVHYIPVEMTDGLQTLENSVLCKITISDDSILYALKNCR